MLELHKIRKDFHRYQHEQKLPSCLRHNLKRVTIHSVINKHTENNTKLRSYTSYIPSIIYTVYSKLSSQKVNQFIYKAFYTQNIKLIRIVFDRFNEQLKYMLDNDLLHFEKTDRYISINNMHMNERKYKHWYKLLKLTVDTNKTNN